MICLSDGQQNALETGTSEMIIRRKVGAAEEWATIGSKKRGERPATLSADCRNRGLVSAIDIRTLVAINLHGDELVIDDRGDLRIVVRLAIHYMAPVAPHGANVEQNGLVLLLRLAKGLVSPLMPLDRLMHGRAQISRRGARE